MAAPTPAGSFNYAHLAANGTTTLKTGVGMLNNVTLNIKGGTGNTVTIYDNTAGSGTVLAVIDTTQSLVTLAYDVTFTTGLTIVVGGGTAPDITVSYL